MLIENRFTCNLGTVMAVTSTDAAGVLTGVASGVVSGPAMSIVGSAAVLVEGLPMTRQLDPVGSNGISANCVGLTAAPSQAIVVAMR